METPNTRSLTRQLRVLGTDAQEIERVFGTFNVNAPAFREVSRGG
jgi:hypothetical protein